MKRNATWYMLKEQMARTRTRNDYRKNAKQSQQEIIVKRLSSEADNKQVYKPIQPRRFVEFDYEDFTLSNPKKACANYFNLPAYTCDISVSNKCPSCTNISQIPHRKDMVSWDVTEFWLMNETFISRKPWMSDVSNLLSTHYVIYLIHDFFQFIDLIVAW